MSANIAGLCRLCLHNIGEYGTKIAIFETQQDKHDITLATKISACVPFSLEISDNLPKFICKACHYKVNYVYNFKATCIKSQLYLHEQLSGYQICDVQIEYCQNNENSAYLHSKNGRTVELNDTLLSQICPTDNQVIPMDVEDSNVNIEQELLQIPENALANNTETWNTSPQNLSHATHFSSQLNDMSPKFLANDKNQSGVERINLCDNTDENQSMLETFNMKDVPNISDNQLLCSNLESCKVLPSKHDLQENGKSPLQCTLCTSLFSSSCELQSHLIENHSIESNRTNNISMFQEIQNSRMFNHNSSAFACVDVNNSSIQKDLINSLTCECGDIFNEAEDLKKHIVDKHLKYAAALSIGYENCDDKLKSQTPNHCSSDLKCLHCSFNSRNALAVESHQRHCYKQNWPFLCPICKERFLLDEDLQTHKEEIHKDALITYPYICSVCDSKFLNNGDLKIHLNLHSSCKKENKPFIDVPLDSKEECELDTIIFICNFCNEKFVQKSSIEYHMLVHLAERERLSVFVKQLCL